MVRSGCNAPPVVNVWACTLRDYSGSIEKFACALSAGEYEQAQRFVRRQDSERYILGRTLIRQVCAAWSGIAPGRLNIGRTANGRPYLAREAQLPGHWIDFNIAHSGDCVLIAWSVDQPVGVDVEAIELARNLPFWGVAKTAFSEDECSALAAADPSSTALTFCRIWVRKEAILKAEGCGFSGNLRSFSVAIRKSRQIQWLDQVYYLGTARYWCIVDFTPVPGYVAGVAMPMGAILQRGPNVLKMSVL